METLQSTDGGNKKDFNDSGVQDVGKPIDLEEKPAELLDLSDDVLLCILKYCSPMDLKALGFTCPRLGRLIRDRTLWTRVDARGHRTGRARLRWLLSHVLGADTVELKLEGYARAAGGCLGHVNRKRKELEEERASQKTLHEKPPSEPGRSQDGPMQFNQAVDPLARLQRLYAQSRYCGTPSWTDDAPSDAEDAAPEGACPGPQFTLTPCSLRQLRARCSLVSLALDYCNINCKTTGISHFPPTLKKLSLRGSKCYNLPLDKSFLFNIQDYLPEIEYIDVSECEWLEPASLLPLSKMSNLKHLIMRDCYRLSEFVAYASLSTRYGFKKLEVLDVRGSPVADSEVSAFGWLGALRELYAAPAGPARAPAPAPAPHAHFTEEPLAAHHELDTWEADEPEHFKIKPQTIDPRARGEMTTEEIEETLCFHGVEYHLCNEQSYNRQKSPLKRPSESSQDTVTETMQASNSERGQIIEVYLRGRQENPDPPGEPPRQEVANPPREEPINQPDVLPKKARIAEGNEDVLPKRVGVAEENEDVLPKDARIAEENENVLPKRVGVAEETEDTGTCNAGDCCPDEMFEEFSDNEYCYEDNSLFNNFVYKTHRKRKLEDAAACSDDCEAGPSKRSKYDPSLCETKLKKCNENSSSNGIENKPGCSKDVSEYSNGESPSNNEKLSDFQSNNQSQGDQSSNDQSQKDSSSNDQSQNGINHGAGPSKDSTDNECCKPDEHERDCKCKCDRKYEYVRFRQNMDPVIVRRDPADVEREERERENENENGERDNENREVRPRAHVLYVNVGQQLHTVYRLSIHNEPPIFYSFSGNSHLRFRPNVGNIFYTPPTPHLDGPSLVSDSAIRRFGRADVTDENVVHIGPRVGPGDQGARPNRSSLRILSITGYRNITDRSLMHLATAAPELRLVDFSNTRVTERGVENFKSLRPQCEVIFSEYVEKKE